MTYRLPHLLLSSLLLVGGFFLFRIPFYAQELVGEEGIFAHLFLHDVPKPDYLLIARVDGVNLMGAPQHPAPMYEAIGAAGKMVRHLVHFGAMDPLESAFALRMAFSLPLLFVLLGCLFFLYRHANDGLYQWLVLLLVFASSPVLLVSSTELQLDASFGAGIFGVWALACAFLCTKRELSTRRRGAVMFLACFLAGLGKNEWSFVLFVCLAVCIVYARFARSAGARRGDTAVLLLGLLGLITGNVVSFLYDPLNYVMGLQLMSKMSRGESILNPGKLRQLVAKMGARWTYVAQTVLLLMAATVPLFRSWSEIDRSVRWGAGMLVLVGVYYVSTLNELLPFNILSFLLPLAVLSVFPFSASRGVDRDGARTGVSACLLLPLLFSLMLFAAYFLSTWEGGPRYYAVAHVVALVAVLAVAAELASVSRKRFLQRLLLCLVVLHGVSFANLDRFKRVEEKAPPRALGCLPVVSSGKAVFTTDDFLGSAGGRDYFESMSRKYGRPLCGQ